MDTSLARVDSNSDHLAWWALGREKPRDHVGAVAKSPKGCLLGEASPMAPVRLAFRGRRVRADRRHPAPCRPREQGIRRRDQSIGHVAALRGPWEACTQEKCLECNAHRAKWRVHFGATARSRLCLVRFVMTPVLGQWAPRQPALRPSCHPAMRPRCPRHPALTGCDQCGVPVELTPGRRRLVIVLGVASSIISTTPSTSRSAGIRPSISIPRRRAMHEPTWSRSSFSPSFRST